MCFKKPKCDSVQKLEEEMEEGGGIIFDGGLDVDEDSYDAGMWGHTGMALGGTEMVWTGPILVKKKNSGSLPCSSRPHGLAWECLIWSLRGSSPSQS